MRLFLVSFSFLCASLLPSGQSKHTFVSKKSKLEMRGERVATAELKTGEAGDDSFPPSSLPWGGSLPSEGELSGTLSSSPALRRGSREFLFRSGLSPPCYS